MHPFVWIFIHKPIIFRGHANGAGRAGRKGLLLIGWTCFRTRLDGVVPQDEEPNGTRCHVRAGYQQPNMELFPYHIDRWTNNIFICFFQNTQAGKNPTSCDPKDMLPKGDPGREPSWRLFLGSTHVNTFTVPNISQLWLEGGLSDLDGVGFGGITDAEDHGGREAERWKKTHGSGKVLSKKMELAHAAFFEDGESRLNNSTFNKDELKGRSFTITKLREVLQDIDVL